MKLDKMTVGKRYGKALYELAVEQQKTDEVYQELLKLRDVFKGIPDLGNILSDVRLTIDEKRSIMDRLTEHFDGIVKNFLNVAYEYNRVDSIPLMIDEYERRYDDDTGLVLGTVTTAVPLSDEQLTKLEVKVADIFGYEKATLTPMIDPKIIGGVIVEAQHRVIDGSIATQLERMRTAIKNQ